MASDGSEHRYSIIVRWTGNLGIGTSGYRTYSRNFEARAEGKQPIQGSSDPTFQGESSRWNPEELLVASVSACHQLWYLHLASEDGITVVEYNDQAEGILQEHADGSGQFTRIVLRPTVIVIAGSDVERAEALHHAAHQMCFIANSVKFSVTYEPKTILAD
jgi:organic hydroperoxide reductase OsmC/OhrA